MWIMSTWTVRSWQLDVCSWTGSWTVSLPNWIINEEIWMDWCTRPVSQLYFSRYRLHQLVDLLSSKKIIRFWKYESRRDINNISFFKLKSYLFIGLALHHFSSRQQHLYCSLGLYIIKLPSSIFWVQLFLISFQKS